MANGNWERLNGLAVGNWQLAVGDDNGDGNGDGKRQQRRVTVGLAVGYGRCQLPTANCQLPRR